MTTLKENSTLQTTALTDLETALDGMEALVGTTNTNIAGVDAAIDLGTTAIGLVDAAVDLATAQLTNLHTDLGTTLHADLGTTLNATIASLATSLGTTMGANLTAQLAALVAATNGSKFISIPLQTLFLGNGTTTVSALGPATAPALAQAGANDPNLLLTWVASADDTGKVALGSFCLPDSWPSTANLRFRFRAKEGVNTDHPVMTLHTVFDEGDTQVVDTSAAITGTSYAEYTITVANADIKAGARVCGFEMFPAAHATENNTVIVSSLCVDIVIP
jgi:hypothetical protein